MTYTHYRSNGEMVDDWAFLDLHGAWGVGQYAATWTRIQAEWYMSAVECRKVQIHLSRSNESFAMLFVNTSSTLAFPNVADLPIAGTLTLGLASVSGRGVIALFADADGGAREPLARCAVSAETTVTCPFTRGTKPAVTGVVFKFEPTGSFSSVQLDWWSLQNVHSSNPQLV